MIRETLAAAGEAGVVAAQGVPREFHAAPEGRRTLTAGVIRRDAAGPPGVEAALPQRIVAARVPGLLLAALRAPGPGAAGLLGVEAALPLRIFAAGVIGLLLAALRAPGIDAAGARLRILRIAGGHRTGHAAAAGQARSSGGQPAARARGRRRASAAVTGRGSDQEILGAAAEQGEHQREHQPRADGRHDVTANGGGRRSHSSDRSAGARLSARAACRW